MIGRAGRERTAPTDAAGRTLLAPLRLHGYADSSGEGLVWRHVVDERFAIIIPMAQSARTLGLEVMNGPLKGLELHSWAETKGSAGAINMAAWTIPGGQGNEEAMDLIREWAKSLPRCPWKWSFGERSRIGYLLPVFRRSRKAFAKLGLTKWDKK